MTHIHALTQPNLVDQLEENILGQLEKLIKISLGDYTEYNLKYKHFSSIHLRQMLITHGYFETLNLVSYKTAL